MSAAVSLENLRHTYPAKGKAPAREALKGVSFQAARGETFGLLGPNGGGKSTTFRILSTYFAPTSGAASVLGFDLKTQPAEVRKRIGVVFQNPSLDAKLSVEENMRHQGELYSVPNLAHKIGEPLER